MEVLEKRRGRGCVRLGDDVVFTDVPYQLTIWRQSGGTAPFFDGRLDVESEAAIRLLSSPILSLELEDRRLLYFRMMSSSGRIMNAEREGV